ncbi:hypothetical protein GCM10023347_40420 [Streptomyces chumphonensis]|uniref:DUF397 domain-containing protein n=1 Tax=Streptomyces chumphonensis TaxID=1214925 RepID=A0A927EW35_9ACTN|nr:DUF397 domain-containing protein [Streptomyces chumphonensis]MBD3930443.1 DUF397 domain-containing protein [Streptomyces chumphonensis]
MPITWRKSSYSSSNGGECLEVGVSVPGVIPVRDSKTPNGPVLVFTPADWSAFVTGLTSEPSKHSLEYPGRPGR